MFRAFLVVAVKDSISLSRFSVYFSIRPLFIPLFLTRDIFVKVDSKGPPLIGSQLPSLFSSSIQIRKLHSPASEGS